MNIFKEVKERSNIEEVAKSLGINLNKANKAICPFHNENTPSFSIHPKKQIFKCFGCGEKGDSITLVAKVMNISYLNAAIYINEALGLGIDFDEKDSFKGNGKDKLKVRHINNYEKERNISSNTRVRNISISAKESSISNYGKGRNISSYEKRKNLIRAFEKWENETFIILSDYRRALAEKIQEERKNNIDKNILEKDKGELEEFKIVPVENKSLLEKWKIELEEYKKALEEIDIYLDIFTSGSYEEKLEFYKNNRNVVKKYEGFCR